MSDLISGSQVYDELGNKLTWLMGYGDDVYLAVGSDIKDVIYNMPTAYSIDKVVEELETDSSVKLYGSGNSDNYLIPVKRAIEIVKAGGKNEVN